MGNWWSTILPLDVTARRNFLANLFDGAIYSFGMSFISTSTVLPVLVKRLGGSNLVVGLVPVVWIIGFNFPQIIIANYAGSLTYKKPLLLKTAFIQRVPWLLLGLSTLFLVEKVNVDLALLIFFVGFASAAVAGSVNLPGWFDLISKLTPLNIRGRLFAYRTLLGSVMGIIGGWSVRMILDTFSFPLNFSLLFFLAFSLMMISYLFLLQLKEEEPSPYKVHQNYRIFIRQLPVIIKTQKNFRNFLIGDALLISALMADAFYTIAAIQRFHLSDGYAGQFLMVVMISMILGNIFFGYLADHVGHRLNLIWAALSIVGACLLALWSPSVAIYKLVFIFTAFTISLIQISRLTIIAELSGENERPTYIALTNLLTSPFILSGIIGGWLADRYDYNIVFILSAILAGMAALWFVVMVDEPRGRHSPKISFSIFRNR